MAKNLITLQEGVGMTSLFRTEKENITDVKYQNLGLIPFCESFDREQFDALLAMHDCKGIRIYSGMDANLNIHFVVVGINSNDEDIYLPDPNEPNALFVIDRAVRCPDTCPPASALNS